MERNNQEHQRALEKIKSLEIRLQKQEQELTDYANVLTLLNVQIFRCRKDPQGEYIITSDNNSSIIEHETIFEPFYRLAFQGEKVQHRGLLLKGRYYTITLTPFKKDKDGTVIEISGKIQDITELYNAELENHQKTQFLDSIIEFNPYSIQILDAQGYHIKNNKAFVDLFLTTPTPDWSILEDLRIKKNYGDQVMKVLNGEVVVLPPEWYNAHLVSPIFPDNLICIAAVIAPIFIDGKLENIIAMHEDITARVNAEKALIKAKNNAEQSDRLKSAFLANVSHEIRTPMNGILGFIQLLKESNLSKEDFVSYLDTIEKSGNHLLMLINNILDISQIESDQMEINLQQVDVNKELQSLYNNFSIEAKKKNIRLLIDFPSNQLILNTDEEKFHAILTNLINNAIKFTHTGSIHVGHTIQNDFLEFYVKDTGIGIYPNQQHEIFKRFIQADIKLSRIYGGSGLGLSISKAYVEMLGGNIRLKSEPDKGSIFYFTLPLNK